MYSQTHFQFNNDALFVRNKGVEIHHGKLDEIKKRTNKFFDTSSMKFNQIEKSKTNMLITASTSEHIKFVQYARKMRENIIKSENAKLMRKMDETFLIIKFRSPFHSALKLKNEFKDHKKLLGNIKKVKSMFKKKEKTKIIKKKKLFSLPKINDKLHIRRDILEINYLPPLEKIINLKNLRENQN